MDNDLELGIQLATVMLAKQVVHPTEATIHDAAKSVAESGLVPGLATRIDELIRALESRFNVKIGVATQLVDKSHKIWLPSRRSGINWQYWERYKQYLRIAKHLPESVVDNVEESVDRILGLLADPARPGPWDRRGLVVGHVQSGKTSNYTGLICKAVDAGYRVIIVLAGIHNSLRSQTQQRLDEGFLGIDSLAKFKAMGPIPPVGVAKFGNCPVPNTVTNRSQGGDFSRKVANQFLIQPAQTLLFVIKKNSRVLENLLSWVQRAIPPGMATSSRPCIPDVPLLVIDDEADHASVDTKAIPRGEDGQPDRDHNPTAINRSIRKLLHSFEKAAYVGYTATPFANIYIHEGAETKDHGADLFPRGFIINLPAPTNYVGPARIFGFDSPADAAESQVGLPILRNVTDHGSWIADTHDKSYIPGPIPPSLREAIQAFVLACAVRQVRGDVSQHNTMLVHVTRFTAVQERVSAQVKEELKQLKQRLRHGDGTSASNIRAEMSDLWNRDFVPTNQEIALGDCPPAKWDDVECRLLSVADTIEVRTVSGSVNDVLERTLRKDRGSSVIAIGGSRLSRGLTLPGLSVGYYLSVSAITQVGYSFGYRPKYLDVCRFYATPDAVERLSCSTRDNEEVIGLFNLIAKSGGTPEEFAERVRAWRHPQVAATTTRVTNRIAAHPMETMSGSDNWM